MLATTQHPIQTGKITCQKKRVLLFLSLTSMARITSAPTTAKAPACVRNSVVHILVILAKAVVLPHRLNGICVQLFRFLCILQRLCFRPQQLVFLFELLLFKVRFRRRQLQKMSRLGAGCRAQKQPVRKQGQSMVDHVIFLCFRR